MGTTPIVTDAALVAAVADGDMTALRELYERHGAWLHARLIRRCNDPEVVVEVVQDTFVALSKDARRFRHDGEVGAWLWGIAFPLLGKPVAGLLFTCVGVPTYRNTAGGPPASRFPS
jgi:hypothetical protein